MKNNRREFIKTSVGALSLPFLNEFDFGKKKVVKLSFSTLGCPDWSFDTIIDVASKNGYNGIEIRGIQRQLDLLLCPEFKNKEAIQETNKKISDKNLRIIDLGSSCNLHFANTQKRKENLDHAKRFIELAEKINCPYVRVFPNDLPKDQDEKATIALIINGLLELGDFAKGSTVKVLMESHGKVIGKDILLQIMQAAEHKNVGLVWDILNMWSVTKESPTEVYDALNKYICHTHIKDGIFEGENLKYVLLGKGVSPLKEAIGKLQKGGYQGYYSFEWEKLWHAEIEEPEIAIPHFAQNFDKFYIST